MTDEEQLRELERALAEDWRKTKDILQKHKSLNDEQIKEKLGNLKVDMVLSEGDTLQDMIQ